MVGGKGMKVVSEEEGNKGKQQYTTSIKLGAPRGRSLTKSKMKRKIVELMAASKKDKNTSTRSQ